MLDVKNREDLQPTDIKPSVPMVVSNDCFDDPVEMERRYKADGYLYFQKLLDPQSVVEARDKMGAPLVAQGLAELVSGQYRWTGGAAPAPSIADPAFSGICRDLILHPRNVGQFARILGEEPALVPMVVYRAYPPKNPGGRVHQDGFYSPGIDGFKPVWIPLVDMDESMGGLTIASGRTEGGFVHNMAKPPMFPIPADAVPQDVWTIPEYSAGDLMVLHPSSPHVGLENRSPYVRMSFDTRVQSARNPTALLGTIVAHDADSVELAFDDGGRRRYAISDETFIRVYEKPAVRLTRDEFENYADAAGLRVLASVNKDRVLMLRRPDMG